MVWYNAVNAKSKIVATIVLYVLLTIENNSILSSFFEAIIKDL